MFTCSLTKLMYFSQTPDFSTHKRFSSLTLDNVELLRNRTSCRCLASAITDEFVYEDDLSWHGEYILFVC